MTRPLEGIILRAKNASSIQRLEYIQQLPTWTILRSSAMAADVVGYCYNCS